MADRHSRLVRGSVEYRGVAWMALLDPETGNVYRNVGLYALVLSKPHKPGSKVAKTFKEKQ